MTVLTEQERHEMNRRLDELEALGIRPHEHTTTYIPESGLWRCVTCPAAFDERGREVALAEVESRER